MRVHSFEKWLLTNHQGVVLHRLQDSTSFRGTKNRSKQPGDYVGIVDSCPLLVEVKETVNSSVYMSKIQKSHQVEALLEWHNAGGIAGYLIMLWGTNTVLWLPIQKFKDFVLVNKDSNLKKQKFPHISLKELVQNEI